jgi:hypothetical protein
MQASESQPNDNVPLLQPQVEATQVYPIIHMIRNVRSAILLQPLFR